MKQIEVDRIVDPIISSDGAGVKLKRSIGVDPDYLDPFLMLDELDRRIKMITLAAFRLIRIEELKQLLICFQEILSTKIVLVEKEG